MDKTDYSIFIDSKLREFSKVISSSNVIPFDKISDTYYFYSTEYDHNIVSDLEMLLQSKVEIQVVELDDFSKLVEMYQSQIGSSVDIFNVNGLDDMANVEIVDYLNHIISDSISKDVTDIHIEPFKDYIRIRRRLNGKLYILDKLDKENLSIIVNRIKITGGMDISEKRLPQDGRITFEYEGREIDLRISTVPVIYGEKIAIRILDSIRAHSVIENTGLNERQLSILKPIIEKHSGFVLVTGPTNSGKSTTIYSILNYLNNEDINITTLENPVEYRLDGVNQIQINYSTGLMFEDTLNSLLRQDPNIISIGELRSQESIKTGLRAAITGHMVFSTLHTNDTISSVFRMMDMGAETYLISNALSLVISQRLVRVLCNRCKELYVDSSGYFKEPTELYRPVGCEYCNDGYTGRTGVFELLEIDQTIRDLINKQVNYSEIYDAARKNGFVTLREHFDQLLLEGITSVEESINIGQ